MKKRVTAGSQTYLTPACAQAVGPSPWCQARVLPGPGAPKRAAGGLPPLRPLPLWGKVLRLPDRTPRCSDHRAQGQQVPKRQAQQGLKWTPSFENAAIADPSGGCHPVEALKPPAASWTRVYLNARGGS